KKSSECQNSVALSATLFCLFSCCSVLSMSLSYTDSLSHSDSAYCQLTVERTQTIRAQCIRSNVFGVMHSESHYRAVASAVSLTKTNRERKHLVPKSSS